MNSKGLYILVERLKEEIEKNKELIEKHQGDKDHLGIVTVSEDYIQYHEEMIKFILKIDKEIENGR